MEIDKIYNEDCIVGLERIPDNSIDVVILDPCYNEWDIYIGKGIIDQAMRVAKPTGNILCFTKQPFDQNLRNTINPIFRREMIWSFNNGGAWVSNRMPLVSFQKVYWCVKSKDFYFNPRTGLDYPDTTRDFKRRSKMFSGYHLEGRQFTKSADGIWLKDHLHYSKPACGEIPAKPLDLISVFLRCFCPDEGIVLDPFIGSATTAIAAIKNNRHFIGFETNKDYYDNDCKRIRNEQRQLKLF